MRRGYKFGILAVVASLSLLLGGGVAVGSSVQPSNPFAESSSAARLKVDDLVAAYRADLVQAAAERASATTLDPRAQEPIENRVADYASWLRTQGDLVLLLPDAANKFANWEFAREVEPVSETALQFEVRWSLEEDLPRLARPDGVPDLGEPAELHSGVLGYVRDGSGNYSLILGKGADSSVVLDSLHVAGGVALALETGVLRIVEGPSSAEMYLAAWAGVKNSAWSLGQQRALTFGLDPESLRIEVTLDESVSDADATRLAALSPLIRVNTKRGTLGFSVRTNDSAPHWGGAAITSSLGACTSGFTVRGLATGTYYGTTAGHCVAGPGGGNGVDFWSGTYLFGTSGGYDFPTSDAIRLSGSSYQAQIYTDGEDPSSFRSVNAYGDGSVGNPVCQSGRYSLSKCGYTIRAINQEFCAPLSGTVYCVQHLARGDRPDGFTNILGDSGGPVYWQSPTMGRSGVRGTMTSSDGTFLYWTKVSTMQDRLNVVPVTLP